MHNLGFTTRTSCLTLKKTFLSPFYFYFFISTLFWWGYLYLIGFLLNTGNRLYVGWFGTLMLPLSGLAIIAYIMEIYHLI